MSAAVFETEQTDGRTQNNSIKVGGCVDPAHTSNYFLSLLLHVCLSVPTAMLQGSGGGNIALHRSRRTLQLWTPTPFFTLKVIKYVSASVTCKIVAANQLWEILHGNNLQYNFNLQYNDPTTGALNIHLQYFTVRVCVCCAFNI